MLKPVIDAIGSIESDSSTLAHIWEALLICYRSIKNLKVKERHILFRSHALSVIDRRSENYADEIYIIAFFLHPSTAWFAYRKSTL
jgi:hypothetical protein